MNKVGINFENVLTMTNELNISVIESLSKLKMLGITSLDVKYERLVGENSYLKDILISNFSIGSIFAFCPLHEQNNIKKALEIVDFCAEYKVKEIMLITEIIDSGYTPDMVFNLKQNLRRIVKYAENFGVLIGLENVGLQGYPVRMIENCVDFVKSVKGVQIVFDGGNFLMANENVVEASKILSPYVQRLHFKNFKFDNGKFVEASTSGGDIDYLTIFNTIKNSYTNIPIVIEFPFEAQKVYDLIKESAMFVQTEMV